MKRPAITAAPVGAVVLRGISPPFGRLSHARGKIAYVLRTRAPLYRGRSPFSCDLHVLGAPLTFALSQDQTLQLKKLASPSSKVAKTKLSGSNSIFGYEPKLTAGTRVDRFDSSDSVFRDRVRPAKGKRTVVEVPGGVNRFLERLTIFASEKRLPPSRPSCPREVGLCRPYTATGQLPAPTPRTRYFRGEAVRSIRPEAVNDDPQASMR